MRHAASGHNRRPCSQRNPVSGIRNSLFFLLLISLTLSCFLATPVQASSELERYSTKSMEKWMGVRQEHRMLEASNTNEFFGEKKRNPTPYPEFSGFEMDPGLRLSGEINNQTRFENLKELSERTGPVLFSSEFRPTMEWTRPRGNLQKIQLKFGAYYQREFEQNPRLDGDFSESRVFLDDTYLKFRFDRLDLTVGNLITTLGTGDEISWLDTLNPRRLRLGLGTTPNRAKMAVPMVHGKLFVNEQLNFEYHLLPVFFHSRLADDRSVWATDLQRGLVLLDPTRFSVREEEKDRDGENAQLHTAINMSGDEFECRFHIFRLFETTPVVSRVSPTDYTLSYPEDLYLAVDGSMTLFEELLLRGELAWHPQRKFTSLMNGVIGEMFESPQLQALFGIDHTFAGELYFNLQWAVSHIQNFRTRTAGQQYGTELMGTLKISKSFMRELWKLNLQAVTNFTSSEYILKPSVGYRPSDGYEFTAGFQLNDGDNNLGPISQYRRNNHLFFESTMRF